MNENFKLVYNSGGISPQKFWQYLLHREKIIPLRKEKIGTETFSSFIVLSFFLWILYIPFYHCFFISITTFCIKNLFLITNDFLLEWKNHRRISNYKNQSKYVCILLLKMKRWWEKLELKIYQKDENIYCKQLLRIYLGFWAGPDQNRPTYSEF
jgi:hypothetical protein